MTDILNLLLIDEDPAYAEVFREALDNSKDGPFHCEWVQTLSQEVWSGFGGKQYGRSSQVCTQLIATG